MSTQLNHICRGVLVSTLLLCSVFGRLLDGGMPGELGLLDSIGDGVRVSVTEFRSIVVLLKDKLLPRKLLPHKFNGSPKFFRADRSLSTSAATIMVQAWKQTSNYIVDLKYLACFWKHPDTVLDDNRINQTNTQLVPHLRSKSTLPKMVEVIRTYSVNMFKYLCRGFLKRVDDLWSERDKEVDVILKVSDWLLNCGSNDEYPQSCNWVIRVSFSVAVGHWIKKDGDNSVSAVIKDMGLV